jgi:hypothetical protein
VPRESPVERGRAWGIRHRIGLRQTERAFGARGWEQNFVRRTPNPVGGRFRGCGWRCSKDLTTLKAHHMVVGLEVIDGRGRMSEATGGHIDNIWETSDRDSR